MVITGISVQDCTINDCLIDVLYTREIQPLDIVLLSYSQHLLLLQTYFLPIKIIICTACFKLMSIPKVFHFIKLTSTSHLFHHIPELWYEKDWDLKPLVSQQGHLQSFSPVVSSVMSIYPIKSSLTSSCSSTYLRVVGQLCLKASVCCFICCNSIKLCLFDFCNDTIQYLITDDLNQLILYYLTPISCISVTAFKVCTKILVSCFTSELK